MHIAFRSSLLLIVAAFSSVAAAPCNTAALSRLLVTGNVTTCRRDAGYDPTSMAMPADAQITAVCNSDACKKSISAMKEVAPDECTVGPIRMYANVINPLSQRCGINSTSEPTAGNAGPVAGNTSQPANGNMTGSAANTSEPNTRSNSSSPSPTATAGNGSTNALTIPMCAAIAALVAMVTLLL
ncbi:unnamed protein product [Hyaloperonospora brassicae]|uniref:Elicitin n=1 Tax=Hyaloperonospora brassicae TaxID=162125 RepID=A0AAV0TM88_HYABA|nr:unnamed protein product [Hyaloperonospora brassicae]